jgi:MinD superfamily P-loop ATPase
MYELPAFEILRRVPPLHNGRGRIGGSVEVGLPNYSTTPGLQSPVKIKIRSKIKIKKRPGVTGCSRVQAKCHGLSRVVSRVAFQKRAVFIDLSRCHGSNQCGVMSAECGMAQIRNQKSEIRRKEDKSEVRNEKSEGSPQHQSSARCVLASLR